MKKLIWIAIMTIVFIGLTACGELPEKPSLEKVKSDVEVAATNTLIGEVKESGEKFLLESVIVDEMELSWVEDDDTLVAETTAFFGNELWKSEHQVSIRLHYRVNSDGEWASSGSSLDEVIIPVKPRE